MVSSALLAIMILAAADQKNNQMNTGTLTILSALLMSAFGLVFAYNTGVNINPMRDFGPRLFLFMAGWGPQVFTAHNYFFWIPIVVPLFGSVIGTLVYLLFISNHL